VRASGFSFSPTSTWRNAVGGANVLMAQPDQSAMVTVSTPCRSRFIAQLSFSVWGDLLCCEERAFDGCLSDVSLDELPDHGDAARSNCRSLRAWPQARVGRKR
jgi:hypothetical protein